MPQLVWAYESHTDLVARELNLDPVEFRRNPPSHDITLGTDADRLLEGTVEVIGDETVRP